MKRLFITLLLFGAVTLSAQGPIRSLRIGSTPPAPIGDVINPVTTITSPTSAATLDNGTTQTITLGGTLVDETQVATNASACTGTGGASGTFVVTINTGVGGLSATWTSASITLSNGSNPLIVSCPDAAGHFHADTITVSFTPPGGTCVAGAGACGDNVSDNTPAIGQALVFSGQDLWQRDTTGWTTFFTQNLNRGDFEGADGSFPYQLGWIPNGDGQPGANTSNGTIENNIAMTGSTSYYVRSTANPTYGVCAATGQGIEARFHHGNGWTNSAEGYFGGYVWTRKETSNGIDRYPNNYAKMIESPFGLAYFQWEVRNPGVNTGTMPAGFIIANAGSWPGTTIFSGNPDGAGNLIVADRAYWVSGYTKRTVPTNITFWIDGIEMFNASPSSVQGNGSGNYVMIGAINSCSNPGPGYTWDFSVNHDSFAVSSQRVYPPAEVWLCDDISDDPRTSPAAAGCVWLVPTHISDTSINFVYRKTQGAVTVPTGTRYISVINNERQISNRIAVANP